MGDPNKPIANPNIVLREEFDDWAVLFDPDTGDAHGLDPVGVFIWKRLDGKHDDEAILQELREACEVCDEFPEAIPADAAEHLKAFIDDLAEKGYVGYE